MSKINGLYGKLHSMVSQVEDSIKTARGEGRTADWTRARIQDIKSQAIKQASGIGDEIQTERLRLYLEAEGAAAKLRKKPHNSLKSMTQATQEGFDLLYHQQRAQGLLLGKKAEDALPAFERLARASGQFRWVYEDHLRDAVAGDLGAELQAEEAIDALRSPEERALLQDATKQKVLRDYDKSFVPLLIDEIDTVCKGEQPAGYDPDRLFADVADDVENRSENYIGERLAGSGS